MIYFVKGKIPFLIFGHWLFIHELAGWLVSWEYGSKRCLWEEIKKHLERVSQLIQGQWALLNAYHHTLSSQNCHIRLPPAFGLEGYPVECCYQISNLLILSTRFNIPHFVFGQKTLCISQYLPFANSSILDSYFYI